MASNMGNIVGAHFKVDFSGLDELERRLPRNLEKATRATANHILDDIKVTIDRPYYPSRVASKPGEPPKRRTGDLRRSGRIVNYRSRLGHFTSADPSKNKNPSVMADIRFGNIRVPYAQYLEPPGHLFRPFIAPAFNRAFQNKLITMYIMRYWGDL